MSLQQEIYADIDWRMSELALLKTIPLRLNFLPDQNKNIIKYLVPAIYAIWEGFIKHCFLQYVKILNSERIPIDNVHINILTHSLTSKKHMLLETPRNNFESKIKFICAYQEIIKQPLQIDPNIPSKSNVNSKVVNDILKRFNLKKLPSRYEEPLNKLLFFRNAIAHGDNAISVDMTIISQFSDLVMDLMIDIYGLIEEGYNNKTFEYHSPAQHL